MNQNDVFKEVLHIGPHHENRRGGISAVLETYSLNINEFKFIPTHDGKLNVINNSIFFAGAYFKIFFKLLFDRKIKIVHIHGSSKGSFYRKYLVFLMAKSIFQKKIVYHLHGSEFHIFYKKANQLTKRGVKHLMTAADIVICLSPSWYTYLSDNFHIKNLCIVNNPVDMPALPDQSQIGNVSELVMLFLGRIGERKGVFDLLAVLAKNAEAWRNKIKVVIGGDGEIERLLSFVKENKLEEIVEYAGWVDGKKKQDLLSRCDILILPSYNEGLPICVLEAMSYGKAIIATSVGGIPEVVKNGENGFLIAPGDKESLEKGICNLINNKILTKDMGRDSLIKVQPYMISNVLNQLESVYKNEL